MVAVCFLSQSNKNIKKRSLWNMSWSLPALKSRKAAPASRQVSIIRQKSLAQSLGEGTPLLSLGKFIPV